MPLSLEFQDSKQARRIDSQRRHFILAFVSYITSTVMFIYGYQNLSSGLSLLTIILFGTGSAFLLNMLLYHLSRKLTRACIIESLLVAIFVLSLVYQGGFNNTALYWVFPFPAILFGLLGVRLALIANTLLLLSLSIMLLVPELILAEYKEAESSRFLASLLIVMIACWTNEYFRERSHEEMHRLQQQKSIQANTDPLTGLANRRFLDTVLLPSLQARSEDYLPICVVVCDIDHFKQLNDSLGHDCGDDVLRRISRLFVSMIRNSDFACRIGGEEFLFIFPHTAHSDAVQIAEKIRQEVAAHSLIANNPDINVTASFGVAEINDIALLEQAIKSADQQLYHAKHQGRNRVAG